MVYCILYAKFQTKFVRQVQHHGQATRLNHRRFTEVKRPNHRPFSRERKLGSLGRPNFLHLWLTFPSLLHHCYCRMAPEFFRKPDDDRNSARPAWRTHPVLIQCRHASCGCPVPRKRLEGWSTPRQSFVGAHGARPLVGGARGRQEGCGWREAVHA